MTYQPLKISGNETGLVQGREQFLLANDAYPVLENAFVWRERIKRKRGYWSLGRLRRKFVDQPIGPSLASPWTFNLLASVGVKGNITAITNAALGQITSPNHNLTTGTKIIVSGVNGMTQINGLTLTITVVDPDNFTIGISTLLFGVYTSGGMWVAFNQPNAELECGTTVITINAGPPIVFTDQGNGILASPTPGNSGTVNYITGSITLIHTAGAGIPTTATFNYFPSIPVMGLRDRDLNNTNNEQTVAFDPVYAYRFASGGWQEFLPGTTWTGTDFDFFWTTNYWVTPAPANEKLFWATNFSGQGGDPIRYTNGTPGTSWINFAPVINANLDRLQQCRALLPFRGRLVAFNTLEGPALPGATAYRQRIRWANIGNPISEMSALFPLPANFIPDAWKDDIRGKGGFLDIPTSESIISVGFVRDNLVIYCERSTWQLRYTGRSIAPFQVEKVNSELGAESAFSAVQFDTSLVGVGDKGIVECDSYQSRRIDIKIPDLVFYFNNLDHGTERVYGIRDFVQKLAFWTYALDHKFPDRRLVYNYENDSWAIFTDSLTALGTFQEPSGSTWANTTQPWISANFPWVNAPALIPLIIGGNQQGFILYLDSKATNDPSLTITSIIGNTTTPTQIVSPNHNLDTGNVIKITSIPATSPFNTLNGKVFGIVLDTVDPINKFDLYKYDLVSTDFSTPQVDPPGAYVGCGRIAIRDNFRIVSKKFNYMDEGQNIQIGFVDVLMDDTQEGEISLNVYLDYEDDNPTNKKPLNSSGDTFFNITVPTSTSAFGVQGADKNWQRVFCPTRGQFITLEWTFSNLQMTTEAQESDVQIDAQILWIRKAGRMSF